MRTVLIVSSVHPPDDPRIRQKLIETLRTTMRVVLVVSAPGPSDGDGLDVHLLRGPRLVRTLVASWKIVRGRYDIASVHDPELLPAAIIAGRLGKAVVFDVHEDIPAQLKHKERLPAPLRPVLSWLAARLLRIAERRLEITLAEPGYQSRFTRHHPVFPNTLPSHLPPKVSLEERSGLVYLGDITRQRGVDLAVEAVGRQHPPQRLTLIGRCSDDFRTELEAAARRVDVRLRFAGYLPHQQALALMGQHRVGISPLRDVPNYRYSQPTKLLEYLAMGLAVVASDLPGGKAQLGGEQGIEWVLAGDARALADGLRRVLEDPSKQHAADAGSASVRERYLWPAGDVSAFYTKAVEAG